MAGVKASLNKPKAGATGSSSSGRGLTLVADDLPSVRARQTEPASRLTGGCLAAAEEHPACAPAPSHSGGASWLGLENGSLQHGMLAHLTQGD